MISLIIVVVVMACAGWMAWSRWHYWRTPIRPRPPAGIAPETLALEALTHGHTCLAEGRVADAAAACERARALDPKRLHVGDRLAAVERRQHAASAAPPGAAVASLRQACMRGEIPRPSW